MYLLLITKITGLPVSALGKPHLPKRPVAKRQGSKMQRPNDQYIQGDFGDFLNDIGEGLM